MPLKPGRENIGKNISEMEASGHSKAQSVAAALHTAYDEKGSEGERHEHERSKYGRPSPY